MKKVGVVTDSHSSISQEAAKKLGIMVLPMPFYIDGVCCYEGVSLSREDFFARLKAKAAVSTSQPSLEAVMGIWEQALQSYDEIVYIPISSGLSGACQTAQAVAGQEPFAGRVYVVDNGRVATPLYSSVLDALELVKEGYGALQIKQMLEASRDNMVIYVAVETLEYLKRGGRISSSTALIGGLLNIKPVLRFDTGLLESYQNCRGFHKAKRVMLEALKHDIDTRFAESCSRGEVRLLAATSASPEETAAWVAEIRAAFPGMEVLCEALSMGVSCHIGPGGLGIGCSCRPKRID